MKFNKYKYGLNWIGIILFLLIPFAFVYVGAALGYLWVGRLMAILTSFIILPAYLIWLFFIEKIKLIFKLIGVIVIIILLWGAQSLVKNSFYLIHQSPPEIEGKVIKVTSDAQDFIFKAYDIELQSEKRGIEKYNFIYSDFWIHTGDHVRIKHIPNLNYILDAELISTEKEEKEAKQ